MREPNWRLRQFQIESGFLVRLSELEASEVWMSKSNGGADIDFGGPATYRILVQGALSSDWSQRLAGMSIETVSREQGQPCTKLVGPIRDQTELSGVLETLYSLHLSILEVEKLDHESRGQEQPGDETRPSRPNNSKEIQEQWTPQKGLK